MRIGIAYCVLGALSIAYCVLRMAIGRDGDWRQGQGHWRQGPWRIAYWRYVNLIPTAEMHADMLTKALDDKVFHASIASVA